MRPLIAAIAIALSAEAVVGFVLIVATAANAVAIAVLR